MRFKYAERLAVLCLAAATTLSVSACSGGNMYASSNDSSSIADNDVITIGSVTTNSGAAAAYGESEVSGFKLAIKEINENGGIFGKQVKLESMDDKGDVIEASNAFNRLAGEKNVIAVLGPTISSTSGAVAPLADQNQMPSIAPAATADSVETGGYLFRTCFKDSYQGEIAAKYAAETLKVKKVAVLYGTGDPYSSGVGKAFVAAAKQAGLQVVAEENSSSTDDTEYSSQLQKIEASGAEFLYAPYYYSAVGPYIVPQARSVGYDGYIMGPDGYDGLKTTGNKARYDKVLYTTHYSPDDKSNKKVQRFITSYKAANNGESPNTFTALGYDSVYMFKQAIEQAGEHATRTDIRNAIAVIVEKAAYKPVREKGNNMTALITAIAMSLLLENGSQAIFGADYQTVPTVIQIPTLALGGLKIDGATILTVLLGLVIMVALQLFVTYTKQGKAMRAVSEDKEASILMGINVNSTITLTFAIGSGLAAVASLMYCVSYPQVSPMMGAMLGLKAFVAAVLGGIGSIPGAMVGGLVIGVVESLTKAYIGTITAGVITSAFSDAIVFGILIIVLLVKPSGLMGEPESEKV